MTVHHDFEMPPDVFEAKKAWPIKTSPRPHDWKGEYASQSPLNQFHIATEGGGACGTRSYLALVGDNSNEFYAEATPWWYTPKQTLDLRNTRAKLYLKAVKPITTNPGCTAHLFIDDFSTTAKNYSGWFVNTPLKAGSDWTLNVVDLVNDESKWTCYSVRRPLDTVLATTGFIGVMYFGSGGPRPINATGVLGIDEFTYGLPIA